MSDEQKPKLVDKPWDALTEAEKRAWAEAAVTNGPRFAGNAHYTGQGFHQVVRDDWRRQDRRKMDLRY